MSFDKVEIAQRMRDLIAHEAGRQARIIAPQPIVARMIEADIFNLKGSAWIVGDAGPIPVFLMPNIMPASWEVIDAPFGDVGTPTFGYGSMVTLGTINGKLYVTNVLSNGTIQQGARFVNYKLVNQLTDEASSHYGGIDRPIYGDNEWNISFQMEVLNLVKGQAIMFGPFIAYTNGPKRFRMTIYGTNFQSFESARTYEFLFHEGVILDDDGNASTDDNRWFRILPIHSHTSGKYDPGLTFNNANADFDIDIAFRRTDKHGFTPDDLSDPQTTGVEQLWFRWIKQYTSDPDDIDQIRVTMSVTNMFDFGAQNGNRGQIIQLTDTTPPAIRGYVGFQNAHHNFHEALGVGDTFGIEQWWGDLWDTGPFRPGWLRSGQDLQRTWSLDSTSNIIWNGTEVSWGGSGILLSGIGRHRNILTVGQAFVTVPAVATNIPVVGGTYNTVVAVTANGIPLAAGRALYVGVPPGSGNVDLKQYLFIVDITASVDNDSYHLPEWAVLIAARPPGQSHLRLGTGATLDFWRNLTLANGWTNRGGGFASGQYRRVDSPPNSLQLVGCLLAGTKTNGTVVATTAAGFRPLSTIGFPCQDTANPAAIEFDTSGQLKVFDLGAGSNLQFSVIVPLDKT